MYNCGWAVTAELKFRQVYGDYTYQAYGDSCGSYIRYNELQRPASGFNRYVNPPVYSWALGNLYNAGIHTANLAWIDAAVTKAGAAVKAWVEEEPTLLSNETWAMSGGATMWGLLNSYFRRYDAQIPAWLQTYKDYMDVFATPGDFTNAWNGWYALGHRAVGEALQDAYHLGVHVVLTDTLIAEDGDGDGGILAQPEGRHRADRGRDQRCLERVRPPRPPRSGRHLLGRGARSGRERGVPRTDPVVRSKPALTADQR